ncbi:MAG: hypothetical protein KDC15_03320 [Chitinophagaceae bacterium]|nr:hypothetical protein [Chitinophagaceae bacterium]
MKFYAAVIFFSFLSTLTKAQENIDLFILHTDSIHNKKIVVHQLDSLYQNQKNLQPETEILLLLKLANAYMKTGEYKKLGVASAKGMELSSKHNYYVHYAGLLNASAGFYYTEGNYEKAKTNYEKALESLSRYGENPDLEMKIENNLGGLLINLAAKTRDFGAAIPHLERSIQMQEQFPKKNMSLLISARRLLAFAYHGTNQNEKRDKLLNELLPFARENGDTTSLIAVLWTATEINQSKKNYNEALKTIDEAIQLTDTSRKSDILQAWLLKALILKRLKRFEEEANLRSKAYHLHNEILNGTNQKQINELETKYHLNEAENKTRIEHEKYLQYLYLFIGSASLLLLMLLFFYFRNVQTKNTEQQLQTQALYEGEQKERIRIAQDLHDSIGQKLSVMKLLLPDGENNTETDNHRLQKISTLLDETTSEVRNISHNLVPEILNFGLLKALEKTAVQINNSKTVHCFIIKTEWLKINLSKQTEVVVFRIVQEILNNMVRHAGASKINIKLNENSNNLQIFIEDNGKGFDPSKMENSEGLGWKNLQARTKLIGGKLHIAAEKGNGSRFEISVKNQLNN